jgi:mannan endo-1,4-beta-mannosidase
MSRIIKILNKNPFRKRVLFFFIIVSFSSCSSFYNSVYQKPSLVDIKISKNAKILHKRLFYTVKKGIAIGHQDATSYGIGWVQEDFSNEIKSDVQGVVGDFPAVFGFDIGKIELGNKVNLDSVSFDFMRKTMIEAHKKGAIITVSWHLDNPTTGGNSWDNTPAVKDIIGEGIHKKKYEFWLKRVADFLKTVKYKGKLVPIIFRPFHEMNGKWFWWGDGNCTPKEYIQLWRETVLLLRDKYKLHNLIYAYSPNKLNPFDNYMEYYPGDDYVDILGIDVYDFRDSEIFVDSMINSLALIKQIATAKNKLFAFTETGLETVSTENWYSEVLYPVIQNSGIAWVLFWRNHKTTHHYMPFKGHASEEDFKRFKSFPETLFLKDLQNITQD